MNEIIIKEPMFPILSKDEKAYWKYYDIAVQYTTPLTFDEWLDTIKNEHHTC